MGTVDDERLGATLRFMHKSRTAEKPSVVWRTSTRVHIVTHLSGRPDVLRRARGGGRWPPSGRHTVVVGTVDVGPQEDVDRGLLPPGE